MMKQVKLLLVAAVMFLGVATVQAQEVAHINTQELVEAMPEMKEAQSQLEKLQKTYDTEIKAMAKELDAKLKQYEVEAESKTDAENQKRFEEVQTMQNNIGAYRQQAMQDLQKKEVDIYKPILDKARQAIQKVGRAKGYKYVIDASPGGGILLAEGPNLMADVKKELGI
ncbi:OmpH family outer membrane protein [Altibacter sp. HG106]|uniref:OmpH family outer membrane protein n=1 Tax=Altibacter sp. HG106 TaxID=3023937 RepID=UPI0030102438